MGDKVAFTAVAAEHGEAGDNPFVSSTIITIIGGGYDKKSGVFTAPVPGLYYFTFSYHGGRQGKTGLQLIKGTQLIVQSYGDTDKSAGNTSDNAGNSAILQLDQDDQVFVRLPAGHQIWGAKNSTSFSGFLISRG